jgi:hypothetical protein
MAKVGSNVTELRVLEHILNTAIGIFLAYSCILVYICVYWCIFVYIGVCNKFFLFFIFIIESQRQKNTEYLRKL